MSDQWYKDGTRAVDDAQKDEILRRLGVLWKRYPQLRLMQLFGNVFRTDPYYIEDYPAMDAMEQKYAEMSARADARRMPSRSELRRWAALFDGEKNETPDTGN